MWIIINIKFFLSESSMTSEQDSVTMEGGLEDQGETSPVSSTPLSTYLSPISADQLSPPVLQQRELLQADHSVIEEGVTIFRAINEQEKTEQKDEVQIVVTVHFVHVH